MIRNKLYILLMLLISDSAAAQGVDRWPALTATVHTLRASMDSLEVAIQSLDDGARKLSGEIAFLSSKDLLSGGERRQLTRFRRRSQALTIEHKMINDRHANQSKLLHNALTALLQHIQSVEDSLARQTPPEREALSRWQQIAIQYQAIRQAEKTAPASWAVMTANPGDTPRTLRLKGDWLSDREATLRREALQVTKRLDDLSREARIRSRVADMDRELSLFNEDEELFARSTRQGGDVYALATPEADYNEIRGEGLFGGGASFLDRPALELTAPVPASPLTLQAWIKRLNTYQNRLFQVADSLKQQAGQFYRQAQNQNR